MGNRPFRIKDHPEMMRRIENLIHPDTPSWTSLPGSIGDYISTPDSGACKVTESMETIVTGPWISKPTLKEVKKMETTIKVTDKTITVTAKTEDGDKATFIRQVDHKDSRGLLCVLRAVASGLDEFHCHR